MAVTPTGAIYKKLTFDGQSSGNYGVYITGEAVYNAPARDVEMIKIPGRNGEFALDNGRFENIEVTYPAGIFADNEADFAAAVSDFRNFLASRSGYCRLEDDYNPNEYRMAVYKSGLDVDPKLLQAGEFDITFDCKPQRWLKEGETAVTVASGDELTNPTLFESQPLLAVKGYGTIGFNGYEIVLDPQMLGHVVLLNGAYGGKVSGSYVNLPSFSQNSLEAGDTLALESLEVKWRFRYSGGGRVTAEVSSNSGISGSTAAVASQGTQTAINISLPSLQFVKRTASSYTNTTIISGKIGSSINYTAQLALTVEFTGTTMRVRFATTYSATTFTDDGFYYTYGDITGESTQSQLGDPTYIDCELGDAYKIVGDTYVSLNGNVDLGSDLPTLAPGANAVTFDNTVTELKITPRWWKI